MARKPQPRDEVQESYVARRLFHHPDGVAQPGETVQLTGDTAERAVRSGDVRPASPDAAPSTVQPSTEEIA